MLPLDHIQRSTRWLGGSVFGLLLALSAWFFRERSLFSDIAFQTFLMLKEGGLQIMVGRWVAAGTHLWPWLAVQLQLPLAQVLLAFSVGFGLFYLLVFQASMSWLRQWRWGLLAVFGATFLVKDTFFWITSELAQGLAFFCFAFAWLHARDGWSRLRWFDFPLLAALMATLVYAHPMMLFPTVFACLFFLAGRSLRDDFSKITLLTLAVFAGFWILKNYILPLNWYDAMSQERLGKLWLTFPNWFDIPANRDFLRWCVADWWLLLPTLVAVCGFYFFKKKWLKLALTACFSIAYVLLVNVSFADGDRQFYLESLYQPLFVFIGIPLIWDVLPFEKKPKMAFGVLAFVAVAGLVRIAAASEKWTARLRWQQDFLKKTAALPQRKLVLDEKDVPMDLLQFSWGTPYEFLLLSSLAHADSARCIVVDESPTRFEPFLTEKKLFLGEFKNYRFDELPCRYFCPRDTSTYIFFKKQ